MKYRSPTWLAISGPRWGHVLALALMPCSPALAGAAKLHNACGTQRDDGRPDSPRHGRFKDVIGPEQRPGEGGDFPDRKLGSGQANADQLRPTSSRWRSSSTPSDRYVRGWRWRLPFSPCRT